MSVEQNELVRERGSYVFDDDEFGTRVVPAAEISDMMGSGQWFDDRDYPHKFVDVDDEFDPLW